jgi:hypothetical protein
MRKKSLFPSVSIAFLLLLTSSSIVGAQASRTWVSGVGDDTAACTRTAPCKTFTGALVKTAAGGEINVLDSAGFGSVTINKSITIAAEGVEASVLASDTNGIVIDAGPNDIVTLRGLDINGLGTGLDGISVLNAGVVHIENCRIENFRGSQGSGIDIDPASASVTAIRIFIKDTIVRNNGQGIGGGIYIRPGANVTLKASLDNVRSENNIFGIKVQDFSTVSIRNSTFAGNAFSGITAVSTGGGLIAVVIDHTATVSNGTTGIISQGPTSTVRISNVTISGNTTGLSPLTGGQIISFGTNNNAGNGTDGAPTSVIAQQ